jgi:hypothetical protein
MGFVIDDRFLESHFPLQMTHNNVGALVVVKPGEQKSIAGIITERGM